MGDNPLSMLPVASMLTLIVGVVYSAIDPEFMNQHSQEFFGGVIGVGLAQILAGSIVNKKYTSTLSERTEKYFYGRKAEKKLGEELKYEDIVSGKTTKKDFLMTRGYAV